MGSGNVKVGIDGLADEIIKTMQEVKDLTENAMASAIDKTSREIVKKTKSQSPTKTGKYASGWSSKITTQNVRGSYGRTVYQKSKPGLPHLLQHGHGGPRPARPHQHIPSDEETEALLEQNLEREMMK